jgi:GMP synthase-like glutamine amidotransferase
MEIFVPRHDMPVRVAILDLYDNVPNQGMRCIKEILESLSGHIHSLPIEFSVYECRFRNEFPRLEEYDLYISTGGPGSPYDGEGKEWEHNYFHLIDRIYAYNQNLHDHKKYVFFICHSFQMMCRYFEFAEVVRRYSTSFGIFPVHKTIEGAHSPIIEQLPDPFYAVDSRDWQVLQPSFHKMREVKANVLALEKIRPHVDFERALMAIHVGEEFFATQFHPEADPVGMSMYFLL